MISMDRELREEIAGSRNGKSRWHCPQPLRDRIVDHARKHKRQGRPLSQTAKELGVSESALLKWVRVADGRLRRVRVVEETSHRAELALVTPSGYRLEGLEISMAIEVLRGLGC